MNTNVLVADDEALIRESLRTVLINEGFTVAVAASGHEALQRFESERPDVVLLDLVLGDMDGLDLLRRIQRDAPETKVVIVTAHGSIESAVEAMKLGGYDFIRKPFELEEIVATVRNASQTSALEGRLAYLDRRERSAPGLIHGSAEMARLLQEVELVARSPVPVVLVVGETGTGKQLVARMLHDSSPRAVGPFVQLNCSTLPDSLVESEFFGHERGAFSDARERKLGLVEVADSGTLFLDEVGDLSLPAQAKLLTFLEQQTFRRVGATAQRQVNLRIVAATNRDLQQLVQAERFRRDLYYRLSPMVLRIPPLRARPDDILPLSEAFLRQSSVEFHHRWQSVASETAGLLRRYSWPGNVRELRSVIARAALLHDEEVLRPAHLPGELINAALLEAVVVPGEATTTAAIPTLAQVERGHIRRVLEICGGNRTLAAQHLGITRQTLSKRLDEADD